MSEVSPRISGTEVEFAISARQIGNKYHAPFELGGDFPTRFRDPEIEMVMNMLSNGGRLYKDVNLLEYATPEELSFHGTVAREFAGERIVMDALARYVQASGTTASALIRKRVIGDEPGSSGYHINLLANRKRITTLLGNRMHLMALHLATSQAILGAGAIRINRENGTHRYSYGQKILDLNLDYDLSTNRVGHKPLINLRDEPHTNIGDFRRIHLTSIDSHISPWATEMTLGTCSLILRAIEQGYDEELRVISNGFNSLVTLGQKTSIEPEHNPTTTIERSNGEMTITANQIQERILEIVSKTDHTDEEAGILEEWKTAYSDLLVDPMLLADRSDAMARLKMIREWNERKGYDPDDLSTPLAKAADSMYDRIFEFGTPMVPDTLDYFEAHKRSIPYRLRTRSLSARMPSEDEIADAFYNPPSTTRAYGRGRDIKSGEVSVAQWASYTYNGVTVKTENPYNPDARNFSPDAGTTLTN